MSSAFVKETNGLELPKHDWIDAGSNKKAREVWPTYMLEHV